MASVLFVCLGNICRSPMAEGILRSRPEAAAWSVDSAGTASHHAGEAADPRTVSVLRSFGQDFPHAARAVVPDDFHRFDVLLAMDRDNLADLRRRCPPHLHHKLALALDPVGGGDVPDPYYGGPDGFDRVHELLTRALDVWSAQWAQAGVSAGTGRA